MTTFRRSISLSDDGPKRVNLPARPEFILAYHETDWMVKNGMLQPVITKINLVPGVNGLAPGANPSIPINTPDVLARYVRQGWTILDPVALMNAGLSYDGEMHYNMKGEKVFLTAFETVLNIGTTTKIIHDKEAYHEWVKACIEQGIIRYPHKEIILGLKRNLMAKAKTYRDQAKPSTLARAEQIEADIEVINAWLKGETAEVEPKPKRTRRKKEDE